jgi:hypothetical protein
MDGKLLQALLPILIIGVVLAFRLRSMSRRQPLNVARLWLAPLILIVIAVSTIVAHPPGTLGLAACAAALAVGGTIGWHRGKLTRIERDSATGALFQQASPGAMILLIAIIAIRFAARYYLQGQAVPGKFDQHTLIVTDALLCFAVGLIAMTRIEMGLRARALLAERPVA